MIDPAFALPAGGRDDVDHMESHPSVFSWVLCVVIVVLFVGAAINALNADGRAPPHE